MLNDRLAQLMARKLSGEAAPHEEQELAALLQESSQAHYFFELLSAYWSLPHPHKEEDTQTEDHIRQLIALADQQEQEETTVINRAVQRTVPMYKKWLVAALALGVIASVYLIATKPKPKEGSAALPHNEVVARPGARSYLLLPDGTKVWLNSDSRLIYKNSFNDTIREVTLEGEAYFDVVKDAARPFLVHTSDIDIRVLGTAFNVKSFPQEAVTEATLLHGAIEVFNKKEPKSPTVILRPHEKLIYSRQANAMEKEGEKVKIITPAAPLIAITSLPKNIADTAVVETSWVYNKLVFEGDTFTDLARKMERWFGVVITFKNDEVARYRFRGVFENENVQQALQALQLTASFNYKIKGNEIEIDKK